jgi:CRP/FNR family transcriptional regulator
VTELGTDLRLLPCLSEWAEKDLQPISEISRVKKFAKNADLFKESDSMDYFFIVLKGSIKLYKTSREGKEFILRTMRPGDYFCCAPLFSGSKYYVSATTLEDSELLVIPAKTFKKVLFSGMPPIGQKIITSLCLRIKFLSGQIENLTFKDVEQRVLATLFMLAERKAEEDETVTLVVTHQEVASMVGSVREVISRTMRKLKKEGVIVDTSVKGIKVDRKALARHLSAI